MKVLVDTTAFYALVDADDDNHERAVAARRAIAEEGGESGDAQHRGRGEHRARPGAHGSGRGSDLVRFLDSTDVRWIRPDDHQVILAALLASGRRAVSFVGQAGFHVIRKPASVERLLSIAISHARASR